MDSFVDEFCDLVAVPLQRVQCVLYGLVYRLLYILTHLLYLIGAAAWLPETTTQSYLLH